MLPLFCLLVIGATYALYTAVLKQGRIHGHKSILEGRKAKPSPMDWQTNWPTDTPSYRVALTWLKIYHFQQNKAIGTRKPIRIVPSDKFSIMYEDASLAIWDLFLNIPIWMDVLDLLEASPQFYLKPCLSDGLFFRSLVGPWVPLLWIEPTKSPYMCGATGMFLRLWWSRSTEMNALDWTSNNDELSGFCSKN